MEEYKKRIIEMIWGIDNLQFLIKIYSFVKVKYDREKAGK